MTDEEIKPYLDGDRLYGDDFVGDELLTWFEDEREAYYNLGKERQNYQYKYHEMDRAYGYKHLRGKSFRHVLGIGSAYGDELLPIVDRCQRITIIEPTEAFAVSEIGGVPTEYVKPQPSGDLPFDDNTFDLITCFSALHHMANVSHIVQECFRCLAADGYLLSREPIVSLGDWRVPRGRLTKRQRGIPRHLMRQIVEGAGFHVVREAVLSFGLARKLWDPLIKKPFYNSKVAVTLDWLCCRAFAWNYRYHARSVFQKLRPSVAYYVLQKRGHSD